MRHSVVWLGAGAALMWFVGLGCSLDRTPRPDGTRTNSTVLGVTGGSLVLENGARLDIPPGAFDGSIELAFEIVGPEGKPPIPDSFSAVGSMYVIKPHGTAFDKTVDLSVPAMGYSADELIMLTLADDNDDEWDLVSEPVTVTGDQAIVPLSHLSYYQLCLRPKRAEPDAQVPNVIGGTCGDGTVDIDEACDDGENDGSYGGCMPGCQELAPHCGDGMVSSADGEICDGNCVTETSCVSSNACVMPMFAGDADTCDAVCDLMTVIQTCVPDDGCCPVNCDHTEDSDCSDTCGNGVVDGNETCEPDLGNCPVDCDDGNVCTADMLTGSGCNQACANSPITMPVEGDGCCPPGQNVGTDSDCVPTCGDGFVDTNEVCDDGVNDGTYGGCEPGCQALAAYCGDGSVTPADGETCDSSSCDTQQTCNAIDACLVLMLVGDAAMCNARCEYASQITACADNDDCCPGGCTPGNDNNCSATCGNGTLEAGERCDTAISAGLGACPTTCNDGLVCTADMMVGSGCDQRCTHLPITTADNGADGCCPPGATFNTDPNCLCGNGVVDAGEVCDDGTNNGSYNTCRPGCQARSASYCGDGLVDVNNETCDGNCTAPAACASTNQCVVPMYTGSAGNCDAVCDLSRRINTCTNGDGCCPNSCNSTTDNDCDPVCGDGVVDAGEACDDGVNDGTYGGCEPGCQALAAYCGDGTVDTSEGETCDGNNCDTQQTCDAINPCLVLTLVGSAANCTARCEYVSQISSCTNNDGCCPGGCTPSNDNNCSATCGNGTLEAGERCDTAITSGAGACPSSCDDGLACTSDMLTGSACDQSCTNVPITAPDNGADGCCPPGANFSTDSNCLCGNGTVDPGEVCDDGTNDGSYDTCQPGCQARAASYCGDGLLDLNNEACDDGVNNGAYGGCAPGCQARAPYCGDSNVDANFGEACDNGVNNGGYNGCEPGCQARGPYCGDMIVQRPDGEVCDDGINDNSYNGCSRTCRDRGPYCGDLMTNGPETCDGSNCPTASGCVAGTCQTATFSGDPSACNAVCTIADITVCQTGDGCCPSGCTNATDLDCLGTCGDGIKDLNEFCDDGLSNGKQGACNLTCTALVKTYAELHALFIEKSCAETTCHGQAQAGRLGLSNPGDYSALLMPAACDDNLVRVVAGQPDGSLLTAKVDPNLTLPASCPNNPQQVPPHDALLTGDEVMALRDWIRSL